MGHALHHHLRPVRFRQRCIFCLRAAAWGLLIAAISLVVLILSARLFDWSFERWLVPALALAGPVLGALVALVLPQSWRAAAVAVDRHYNLKDRAATALEFLKKGHASAVHQLQVDDALQHLDRVNPREVVPFTTPRPLPYAVAALIGAAVLMFTAGPQEVDAGPSEPLAVIVEQADRAAEELRELEEFAKEEKDPELEKLVALLQEKIEEMKEPGVDSREALAKLSEMQAALQTLQAQYNVGEVDAYLQAIGEALSLAEPMAAAGKALEAGQLDKAADELAKLESPELDRKTERAVKEKLAGLAKKMSQSGHNALAKATGSLCEGLGGDETRFREGAQCLSGECKNQGRRKKISDLLYKQSLCLGECKSECEGSNCTSRGQSKGKGGKNWGLAASGNEAGERTPNLGAKREEKLTGKQSEEGESEIETMHSPEGKQEAQRQYRETYARYKRISEAVLDSEPIPLGHRQTIRRYFELIRPQEGEVDAVNEATK